MKKKFTLNLEHEFATDEGCFITEQYNCSDDGQCSVALARVPVGGVTRPHKLLGIAEKYLIKTGQGVAHVDGEVMQVGPNDIVIVPPEAEQWIENTSLECDLVFYCICTPRFVASAYVDCLSGRQGQQKA